MLAGAALGVGCHSGPPSAVDPAMAACVPPGATILAGANLARIRTSPVFAQLPPSALAFLEPLHDAASLLVASNGTGSLILARGSFQQPPAGATLLAPGLAAAGSPDWLRTAQAQQHRAGAAPAALLEQAEPLAATTDLWMVAEGSANLPFRGNGENLNHLLHTTRYTTWSVRLTTNIAIEVAAVCAAPETARHLEETARAYLTLGAASTARQPELSNLLRSIQIRTDDRTVHLNVTAQSAELDQLLKLP